jgi:hypothetical protein
MRFRELLGPPAAALSYHALYVAVLLAGARADPTVLLCVGERVDLPPGVGESARFVGQSGYDGQFTALVALDPLDRRDTARHLDDPGKRFARILLPGLAWLAGARNLRQAAWRLAAANALAAAIVAAAVVSLAPRGKGAKLAAVAAAVQPGIAVAVSRCTPGVLGLALVLLALVARRGSRPYPASVLLSLAALDQEIFAAIPVALAAASLWRGRRSGLAWLLALGPAALWRGYLAVRGFEGAIPTGDVGLLGGGIVATVLSTDPARGFLPQTTYEIVHALSFALSLLSLRRQNSAAPGACFAAVWLAGACADRDVWVAFWSASRATAPAFALAAARGDAAGRIAVWGAALFSPFLPVWFSLYPPDLA